LQGQKTVKERFMKQVLVLLVLLGLLAGCGDDEKEVTNSSQATYIWPLKVGNQWTIETTVLDSAGEIIEADTVVFELVGDTLIQDETWYILAVDGMIDPEMSPLTNRDDGLWHGGPSGGLIFKYPAAVNDTFMVGTDTATVESINDTITVPAGTFICYNYKWAGPSDPDRPYQFHYLAPRVGIIKDEEYRKTAGGYIYCNIRWKLLSYSLQ